MQSMKPPGAKSRKDWRLGEEAKNPELIRMLLLMTQESIHPGGWQGSCLGFS